MSEAGTEISSAEPQTSDPRHDNGGSFWILWIVIVLLLAYPLSLGPVVRIYRDKPAPAAVAALYRPFLRLYYGNSTAQKVIRWYIHLWGVRHID